MIYKGYFPLKFEIGTKNCFTMNYGNNINLTRDEKNFEYSNSDIKVS